VAGGIGVSSDSNPPRRTGSAIDELHMRADVGGILKGKSPADLVPNLCGQNT
jgi:hypothetical protein